MKIAARILSLVLLAGLAISYTGCKKDKDGDPLEKTQLAKLNSVWVLSSANDGTTRTADFKNANYPDLKLTLSGTFSQGGIYTYSFTGYLPEPSPWPKSGNWKFGTEVTKQIIRDPATQSEINMDYTVTNTGLIITFNLPEGHIGWPGGVATGRAQKVSGDWRFEFTKQ